MPLVVFVDDREGEGVEDGAAQAGIQAFRVALRHQAHLLREREVEVGDLAVPAPACPVADGRARGAALERMPAVEAPETRVGRVFRPPDRFRASHPARVIGASGGALDALLQSRA